MSILTMNERYTPQAETVAHIVYDNNVVLSKTTEIRDSSGVYNYGLPEIPLPYVINIKEGDEFIFISESIMQNERPSFYVYKAVCNGFYSSYKIDWINYTIITPSGKEFKV